MLSLSLSHFLCRTVCRFLVNKKTIYKLPISKFWKRHWADEFGEQYKTPEEPAQFYTATYELKMPKRTVYQYNKVRISRIKRY